MESPGNTICYFKNLDTLYCSFFHFPILVREANVTREAGKWIIILLQHLHCNTQQSAALKGNHRL